MTEQETREAFFAQTQAVLSTVSVILFLQRSLVEHIINDDRERAIDALRNSIDRSEHLVGEVDKLMAMSRPGNQ